MNREVQVRICEGLGVKFPGPTRPRLPTWALQQVDGYLGYTGHGANIVVKAACDPEKTSRAAWKLLARLHKYEGCRPWPTQLRHNIDGIAVSPQPPRRKDYFRVHVVCAGESALRLIVERRARNPALVALASRAWKIRGLPEAHATMFRCAD